MDEPVTKAGAWILASPEVLDDFPPFDPQGWMARAREQPLPPMGVRSIVRAYMRKFRLAVGFAILPDDWRYDDD